MRLIIGVYRVLLQPKAHDLNSTNISFLTFLFAFLRLFFWDTHTHMCVHTQTLVECVNSLMAWLPFERNILTKKYEITELVFLWLILSPSPSDWEGPFNSWQAPVFCPVNYIHTNLPASYPLFHFLETVFKEHILCIACLPLFWINPHVFPLHSQNKNSCAEGVQCSSLSGVTNCSRAELVIEKSLPFQPS